MDVSNRLLRLDTCVVSDALDALGLSGATTGIRPLWPMKGVLVGRARTIKVAPRGPDTPGTHIATPLIERAQPGDVLVIDNAGRTDVSCWGGILSVAAIEKAIAGVLIDGACRDISESEELGLPVFGRAVVPVSARGRIVQLDMDIDVTIAQAAVSSGDYVIADRNGAVFVRASDAGVVLENAERLAGREAKMLRAIRSGRSVVEVMHDSQFDSAENDP